MDLNLGIFMAGLLVLSILVGGNFLHDQEANWLEGALPVVGTIHLRSRAFSDILQIVYVVVAIASFYSPHPDVATSHGLQLAVAESVRVHS